MAGEVHIPLPPRAAAGRDELVHFRALEAEAAQLLLLFDLLGRGRGRARRLTGEDRRRLLHVASRLGLETESELQRKGIAVLFR